MAGPQDLGDHVVLDASTFDGVSALEIKAVTSGKLILSGWDLTLSGTSALSSIVFREKTSRVKHASSAFVITSGATAGMNQRCSAFGMRITIAPGQGLELAGGATGGALSGTIWVREIP